MATESSSSPANGGVYELGYTFQNGCDNDTDNCYKEIANITISKDNIKEGYINIMTSSRIDEGDEVTEEAEEETNLELSKTELKAFIKYLRQVADMLDEELPVWER